MNSWSEKDSRGLLPSDDPNLAKEIDKQNEELESIKNWGVDESGTLGQSGVEIKYFEDGKIQSAVINPWSTGLNNTEVLLWNYAHHTKGLFRVKVLGSMVVTNFRIMVVDHENNRLTMLHLFPNLDDVVVMNTHRVSNSIGYGMYAGRFMAMAGPRFSSGTSKTVGDIIFIENGQKSSWTGIPDPTGLKNFIKSIKKTMYDPLTKLSTKSRALISCLYCGQQNPKNSKFCNGCGKTLVSVCQKCGKSNPLNSSYCGQCGFVLQ